MGRKKILKDPEKFFKSLKKSIIDERYGSVDQCVICKEFKKDCKSCEGCICIDFAKFLLDTGFFRKKDLDCDEVVVCMKIWDAYIRKFKLNEDIIDAEWQLLLIIEDLESFYFNRKPKYWVSVFEKIFGRKRRYKIKKGGSDG